MQRRAVLMDVRLAQKYDANACPNSQSFPLYQPISGMGLAANIRRAGFTFFGVFGTERNMQWLQQVEDAVPKSSSPSVLLRHPVNTAHSQECVCVTCTPAVFKLLLFLCFPLSSAFRCLRLSLPTCACVSGMVQTLVRCRQRDCRGVR